MYDPSYHVNWQKRLADQFVAEQQRFSDSASIHSNNSAGHEQPQGQNQHYAQQTYIQQPQMHGIWKEENFDKHFCNTTSLTLFYFFNEKRVWVSLSNINS